MNRHVIAALAAAVVVLGPTAASAQLRPPMITSVSPSGLQRGTTATLALEGTNLDGADRILFEDARMTGRILSNEDRGPDRIERDPASTAPPIVDIATRHELSIQVEVPSDVPLGRHGFRLRTPLGTTNLRWLAVGAWPEMNEAEPNDTAESGTPVPVPVTVNASIGEAGDVDCYRFDAAEGQQLVFSIVAAPVQSRLDAVVEVLEPNGAVLARNDDFGGSRDSLLVHTFDRSGSFTACVADALHAGGDQYFYRLAIGAAPLVTSVFPLGGRAGRPTAFRLQGAHLGEDAQVELALDPDRPNAETLAPKLPALEPIRPIRLAVGRHPEVEEQEPNDTLQDAQAVQWPVTINGRIERAEAASARPPPGPRPATSGPADEDWFRFQASHGQPLVFSVMAQRVGSPLDSVLEILDAGGRPVPRAVLRPVWETVVDLRSHGSNNADLRVLSWTALRRGDFIYVDRELMRIRELPKSPDESLRLFDFRGRRLSYQDTSPEGHALNQPVYKVDVHPPGTTFSPNGLPLFDLTFMNDDGGPVYGKDSYLTFTPPADGEYVVRLRDSRGLSGPDYAYRLTIAEPAPDFTLFVSPSNPNVPRGGRVPVVVSAFRHDGFDGPIEVRLDDLPPGLTAAGGVILPGHNAVTLTLAADEHAGDTTAPLRASGASRIDGELTERLAMADEPVSVITTAAPPDLRIVSVEPSRIELRPGEQAQVSVAVARQNGFAGRVPLTVQNLPFLLTVPDVGLNGILITEDQESRTFTIAADEQAPPLEQTMFMTGRVETNGGQSEHASEPFVIKVLPPAPKADVTGPEI
jgi:hypothetical protein